MTRMISQALLLGLLAVMTAILVSVWNHPARETVITGAALALIALSLALERSWPQTALPLPVSRAEQAGDIGSFVLIFGLLDAALKWLTPFVILALLPEAGGFSAPLWLQIILVVLWIEFAAWGSHWGHHRFRALWALHAMHHSPEHMHTMNNFRFHPLNHVLNHLAMILPPLLVGINPDAILVYSAMSLPVLLLQHTNVAFDFGRLNLLFNTNDLHRWHHSAQPSEGVMNLGRTLVLWDQIFGTYLRPATQKMPTRIGLFDSSRSQYPVASRYFAQLAWPFAAACCSTHS